MGWAGTVAQQKYSGMPDVRMEGDVQSMMVFRFIVIIAHSFVGDDQQRPKTRRS